MRRYALRDDQWDRIKDGLPGSEGHVGVTAEDNRLFVDLVSSSYFYPLRNQFPLLQARETPHMRDHARFIACAAGELLLWRRAVCAFPGGAIRIGAAAHNLLGVAIHAGSTRVVGALPGHGHAMRARSIGGRSCRRRLHGRRRRRCGRFGHDARR